MLRFIIGCLSYIYSVFFFFNDTATTEIYTLSLHDALPISRSPGVPKASTRRKGSTHMQAIVRSEEHTSELQSPCNLVCRLLLEKKKREWNSRRFSRDVDQSHGFESYASGVRWRHSLDLRRLEDLGLREHHRYRIVFFFNDTATTEIYTLSLHDALPI